MNFQNIYIIGAGLIGGSLAKKVKKVFPNISLTLVQKGDICGTLRDFCVTSGTFLCDTTDSFADNVGADSLIILACHIEGCLNYIEKLSNTLKNKQNVYVTDVSSVKRVVCAAGEQHLPEQFVGGHPMAGREKGGFANSTADLFDGKAFLLCPTAHNSQASLAVGAFMRSLGMSVKEMDAETHDRVMAYVSHFPQLYALLITKLLDDTPDGERILHAHGGALADQLRLAASPYDMWGQVFAHNKDNLHAVLEDFAALLIKATHRLDAPEMSDWFAQANHIHQQFADYRAGLGYDPFQTSADKKDDSA